MWWIIYIFGFFITCLAMGYAHKDSKTIPLIGVVLLCLLWPAVVAVVLGAAIAEKRRW